METIVEGYECIQTAKKNIINLIEKSDKVEVDLIDIKRLLERASLSLEGVYLNILAEEAGIDIDVEAEEYLAKLERDQAVSA